MVANILLRSVKQFLYLFYWQPYIFIPNRRLIPFYFVDPKFRIGFRNGVVLASLMTMPKATIHKDAGSVLPHHDVGFPWQSWLVQSITESMPPQPFAHNHLRLCVSSVDGCHVCMRLLWCKGIRHNSKHLFFK